MLQWIDNFQQYGTSTTDNAFLLNGAYDERGGSNAVDLVEDPDTASTVTVLLLQGTILDTSDPVWGAFLRKVVTASGTLGVMARIWLVGLPADESERPQIALTDASNTTHLTFLVSPIGSIKVYRGNLTALGSGTLLGESSPVLGANAWHHVEIKAVISDAAGAVEIRVDDTSVLNLTGIDTKNSATATISNVVLSSCRTSPGTSSGKDMYVKDLVIWDNTGSYNNDFLGNCSVVSLRPDGDDSGTWSKSTGSVCWSILDNTTPLDDSGYIYSPTPPATAQVETMTDLPEEANQVLGIMTLVRTKKSDGGDAMLQVGLVSNGTTGNGADRNITTAYTYWSDIFEEDPDTTDPWTVSAVNAVKMKLNRTA